MRGVMLWDLPREWTSWMPMLEQRLETLNEQSSSQALVRTSSDVKAKSHACCCWRGLLILARLMLAFWRSRSTTDRTGSLANVRKVEVPWEFSSHSTDVMSFKSDFQARTTFSRV
jgi:hypothetical protein